MKKRVLEFLGLVVVVAAVALFLASERKLETPTPEVTSSPEARRMSPEGALELREPSVPVSLLEDFENAEGMEGYHEVRVMEIPPADSASLVRGKLLAEANCATCHGQTFLGDGEANIHLAPKANDLTSAETYKYGHRELSIYRTAAHGIPGTAMVDWGDILSKQELWDITHYIVSLQKVSVDLDMDFTDAPKEVFTPPEEADFTVEIGEVE